jgi:hypothetical protein
MKKAQGFPWNWRRRYCVFHRLTRTLCYYASAEDAAAGINVKGQVSTQRLNLIILFDHFAD